jgi:hypothetical protein
MTNLSYNNHFLNEWQGHWSHMIFFMITRAMSHGLLYEPNTAQIWKSVELSLKSSHLWVLVWPSNPDWSVSVRWAKWGTISSKLGTSSENLQRSSDNTWYRMSHSWGKSKTGGETPLRIDLDETTSLVPLSPPV